MAKILVTGGTGVLGSYLVPRLVARGHEVRRLSRHASGPDAVRGDVRTGEGIDSAVAGCDTVIHAATNLRRFRSTEVGGTRHVAQAAGKVGAHLIYVSIVGVDQHRLPYYKAKWEAEQVVEQSGARWTVLRATQFHDLLDRVLGMRVVTMPRRTPFQPVDGGEVADALVSLVDAGPTGRAPDVGGPQVLTIKKMNDIRSRVAGKRAVLVPVPAVWFLRDFVDGNHLLADGVTGELKWEEWLRKRAAS
ncbi:MAG TPA: NAD(P)H-binding protein [Acidimicrobiales bacterium]|nr:NAD(P)H-binding protein [Acidimicrobiales bacterium]